MFILRFHRFTGACFRVFLLRQSLIPTWENKQMQLRSIHQSKVFMNSCRENECKDAPDISKHCTLTEPVQHSNDGATVCATNLVHSFVLVWARGNTVHWSLIHTLTHTQTHCWRLKVFRCYRENTEQCLNGSERVCRTYSTRPLCFSDFKPLKTCSAAHIHS